MSLQKTTSSYGWMTKANIFLYTIKVKGANICMKILLHIRGIRKLFHLHIFHCMNIFLQNTYFLKMCVDEEER
jgi:hypothetical protein